MKLVRARLIGEKAADLGYPHTLSRVVVVHQRKDIEVDVVGRDGARDLGFAIDLMDRAAVDERIGRVVGRVGLHLAVRRDDVQPLRKQQVDLADVLLQRRVAGRIVFDVVRRAQTFARVQGNVARLHVRPAVGRPAQFDRSRRLDWQARGSSASAPAGTAPAAASSASGRPRRRCPAPVPAGQARRRCGAAASSACVVGRRRLVCSSGNTGGSAHAAMSHRMQRDWS